MPGRYFGQPLTLSMCQTEWARKLVPNEFRDISQLFFGHVRVTSKDTSQLHSPPLEWKRVKGGSSPPTPTSNLVCFLLNLEEASYARSEF